MIAQLLSASAPQRLSAPTPSQRLSFSAPQRLSAPTPERLFVPNQFPDSGSKPRDRRTPTPMVVPIVAPMIALMILPDTIVDRGNAPRFWVRFVRK